MDHIRLKFDESQIIRLGHKDLKLANVRLKSEL